MTPPKKLTKTLKNIAIKRNKFKTQLIQSDIKKINPRNFKAVALTGAKIHLIQNPLDVDSMCMLKLGLFPLHELGYFESKQRKGTNKL